MNRIKGTGSPRNALRALGRWTTGALSAVGVAALYYIVLTRGRPL